MEKLLVDLEGVICMMYNILVLGNTPHEYWQRLKPVLQQISENDFEKRKM